MMPDLKRGSKATTPTAIGKPTTPSKQRDEVVVVHDYLTQRGGAERVVLMLMERYPEAKLLTAAYAPERTFSEFQQFDIRTVWTDQIPLLRKNHRLGILTYPLGFSSVATNADLTICTSSGFAHGVRANGPKLTYCFNPARWLYSERSAYLAGWPAPVGRAVRTVGPALRAWDRLAMRSSNQVITSSNVVKRRIADAYGIDATIVPPPAGLDRSGPQSPVPGVEPGYFLTVGRLLAYKNVDIVAAAMRLVPGERLVVVGDGPHSEAVDAVAGPNVKRLRSATDAELRWLYRNCAAVVSAAREDYGLTPIEGAGFGRPSVVLRFGGFRDTVVGGRSGVFFENADSASIAAALERFRGQRWDSAWIEAHADRFSQDRFNHLVSEAAETAVHRYERS